MSIQQGLKNYYDTLGVRGVLAIVGHGLFGFPKEITSQAPGIRGPVHLRLRTSDPRAYSEILLRQEYAFDLPFVPETILDAGANVGMTSIYFANRYPQAKIFAVEPEPANYAMLQKNARPYPSITPIHAALWNRDGHISIATPDKATGASGEWAFVTREGPGVSVQAMTIPTLMREFSISTIDLAKIDVEGAEQELFEDAGWLAGTRCVMIELHDRLRAGCSEAVAPALRDFKRIERGETICFLRDA